MTSTRWLPAVSTPFPARISDVGVVKDLATHDVDLAAWVAGSEYKEIYAQTAHRSGREHEDMVVASGSFKNGVLVNHLVNWLTPLQGPHHYCDR